MFLLVSGPQVTFGVFDLKPGLLLYGCGQRVFIHKQKRHTDLLITIYYKNNRCVKSKSNILTDSNRKS